MNISTQQSANPTSLKQVRRFAAETAPKQAGSMQRMMGMATRDSFQTSAVLKDAAHAGVLNIPFDALFQSQEYREGKLKANEYVAKIITNSVGFGVWTIGGAAAAVALAPLALPGIAAGAIGFAVGMTCQDLFDRFFGHSLAKSLANAIPDKDAKGFADSFTQNIANPLYDHVWRPVADTVMGNKVLTAAAVGLLALKFPKAAKAVAPMAGTMGGGMALGIGSNLVVSQILGESKDPFVKEVAATADPELVKAFQNGVKSFMAKGMARAQAVKATKEGFVSVLVKKGTSQERAAEVVAELAKAAAPAKAAGFLATR